MKLLVNDKELAYFLMSLIDIKDHCKHIQINESNDSHAAGAIGYILNKQSSPKFELSKFKQKFKDKLYSGVAADVNEWRKNVEAVIKEVKNVRQKKLQLNASKIIDALGEDVVIEKYLQSRNQHFIKTVGLQLNPNAIMVRRQKFNNPSEDCLLRNTTGNENILVDKIDQKYPFWFIDSGYTNFIEPNKKWHRLVRNHLHFNHTFDAPSDRLINFTSFPVPWKKEGKKILVVEPGPFAASIFHVNPQVWRETITTEIKKYTDRPIEFREKTNKKTRTSLYKQLLDGDYYCSISINSNSAVESVWAGVPAITLDKHVSNPVTRNSISQINDLYYGPLGNWLSWLSYCQFTYDELLNGTAISIVRDYHNV